MPSACTVAADLRRRIVRLELLLATLGVLLLGLLVGGGHAPERMAQVERLELLDAQGRTAAVLESHPQGGGVLRLYDRLGERAVVITAVDGGKLALFGNAAAEVVELGAFGAEGGEFMLRNERGEVAVRITTDRRGRGYVGVFGERGVGRTLQPQPSDALGTRRWDVP